MNSRLSELLIAFLMSVLASETFAFSASITDHLDFYVSPEGSDAATGSFSQPWKSPEAAISRLKDTLLARPGTSITLYFKGGDYQIENGIFFDGKDLQDGQSFAISAAPGEEVVFHGDRKVTGWKKWKGNIWKANLKDCGISDFGEPVGDTNRVDLYCSGKRQILARWPNEGFTKAGTAMGETKLPVPEKYGYHGTAEGVLGYVDARIDRWAKEQEPCAFGYWYWDWAEGSCRIEILDSRNRVMTFEKPDSYYGYRDGCRFYGFNLLCELDAPGEYYIDRTKGILYWYAPEGVSPLDESMTLTVFHEPYMLTISDAENVSVEGIRFRGSRRGGVLVQGGKGVDISKCNFNCFGVTVISLHGGKDHHVDHCILKELDCGGIYASGGDRKTLEPSGFELTNTIVQDFALYKRTYQPAISFQGAGMLIAHNHFEGSSSSAMSLGGNDVTVEYNEFYDLVKESDDQGATDTYFDYSLRRQVYRYNHFRNIKGGVVHGAAGIRLDDIISGQIIYGNVFEDCGDIGFGAVQIHGGKDNWVTNNLFYHCKYAISFSPWPDEKWERQYRIQLPKCEAVDAFGPLYRMRYPELNQPASDNHNRNYSTDNLAVNVEAMYRNGEYVSESGNTLLKDRTEPLSYFLAPSVLASFGLKAIPFGEIGVK